MKPRMALRPTDWPVDLQAAWQRATGPRMSLFGPDGVAADRRPATLEAWQEAVGFMLEFLRRQGHTLEPGILRRISPVEVDGFVHDMRGRGVINSTIRHRLSCLGAAIRVLVPGMDVSFILKPGGVSLRKLLPSPVRHTEIRDHREIRDRALDLFREGLAGKGYAKGRAAIRDAAILATMTVRAPRVGAFGRARLRDLEKIDGIYWLSLPAETSKTGQALRYKLPPDLVAVIDSYLTTVRPASGGHRSEMLWMSTWGQALRPASVAEIVRRRIRQWFGEGRGPHWLRKCLTTTATLEDPAAAFDAGLVLGHSPATSLQHYNKASAVAALGRHDRRISDLQRRTHLLAARAFGWGEVEPAAPKKRQSPRRHQMPPDELVDGRQARETPVWKGPSIHKQESPRP
jgi:hypothetical protein